MSRDRWPIRSRLKGRDVHSGLHVKRKKLHQASLVGKGGAVAAHREDIVQKPPDEPECFRCGVNA